MYIVVEKKKDTNIFSNASVFIIMKNPREPLLFICLCPVSSLFLNKNGNGIQDGVFYIVFYLYDQLNLYLKICQIFHILPNPAIYHESKILFSVFGHFSLSFYGLCRVCFLNLLEVATSIFIKITISIANHRLKMTDQKREPR
jgi:hypothetical protein